MLKCIGSTAEIKMAGARALEAEGLATTAQRVNHVFQNLNKSWVFYLLNFITLGAYSYFAKKEIRVILEDTLKVDFLLGTDLASTDSKVQQIFHGTPWTIENLTDLKQFIEENSLDKTKLASMSFSQIVSYCAKLQMAEKQGLDEVLTPLLLASREELKEISDYLNGKSTQPSDQILSDAAVKFAFLYKTNKSFKEAAGDLGLPTKELSRFLSSLKQKSYPRIREIFGSLILKSTTNLLSDNDSPPVKMTKDVARSTVESVYRYLALTKLDTLRAREHYDLLERKPRLIELKEDTNASPLPASNRQMALTIDALNKGVHPAFEFDRGRNKGRIFSVNKKAVGDLDSQETKDQIDRLSSQFKSKNEVKLLIQEMLYQNFFSVLPNLVQTGSSLICQSLKTEAASTHFDAELTKIKDPSGKSRPELTITYRFAIRPMIDEKIPSGINPLIHCSVSAVLTEDNLGNPLLKADFLNQIRESFGQRA